MIYFLLLLYLKLLMQSALYFNLHLKGFTYVHRSDKMQIHVILCKHVEANIYSSLTCLSGFQGLSG
jgi:hypothetical protein